MLARVGGALLFSAAQLHSTVPNTCGVTRFSIDFRTVHLDDVRSKSGVPNIDSAATGTTLRDYIRAKDHAHLPDDAVALHFDGTEPNLRLPLPLRRPTPWGGRVKLILSYFRGRARWSGSMDTGRQGMNQTAGKQLYALGLQQPRWAYFQGAVRPWEEATLHISSEAVNRGLNVYEGLKGYWQTNEEKFGIVEMRRHYERLVRSAKLLHIPVPVTFE